MPGLLTQQIESLTMMQQLRWIHRMVTVPIVLFTLFLAVTGIIIQVIDLDVILTHAPADNVNVRSMREAFDGPGAYQVRHTQDYLAPALPGGFDYGAALARALPALRGAAAGGPFTYLDFRVSAGRPVAVAGVGQGHIAVDAASAAVIARSNRDEVESQSPDSQRNSWKHLHRMTSFGDGALIINVLVSAGLLTLIVTGLWIYVTLAKQRRKIKKPILYWSAGGTWRALHRTVSLFAAAWLVVVTLSGAWLAVESLGLAITMHLHAPVPRTTPPPPLTDSELPAMLKVTLAAASRDAPGEAVKVLRLRHYGPYAQGVVVTAGDETSRQLVYNAADGEGMSESEPGYPSVPFPFGWQAHQTAKSIHRGDWFGMTGRWADVLAGLTMAYLSLSGIVMYATMWRKRAEGGRKALFWK